MDIRKNVDDAMGTLESLIGKIPGYHGYKEKENRRAADKLMRESLFNRFEEQRRRMAEIQKRMLGSGKIMMIDDLDQAVQKLQNLSDRVKTASYGFSGFFDALRIKEEQLDALYAFDNQLISDVGRIAGAVDNLEKAMAEEGEVQKTITDVVTVAEDINRIWRQRQDVILNVQ